MLFDSSTIILSPENERSSEDIVIVLSMILLYINYYKNTIKCFIYVITTRCFYLLTIYVHMKVHTERIISSKCITLALIILMHPADFKELRLFTFSQYVNLTFRGQSAVSRNYN